MDIKIIEIIGAGTMGGGIAQVAAQSGYEVGEGKLANHEKDRILSNIKTTASLKECKDVDLIIEAVIEKEDIKKQIFKEMDILCDKETLFATNTSSISITRLASITKRLEQFAGMHFHEPCIHNEACGSR